MHRDDLVVPLVESTDDAPGRIGVNLPTKDEENQTAKERQETREVKAVSQRIALEVARTPLCFPLALL